MVIAPKMEVLVCVMILNTIGRLSDALYGIRAQNYKRDNGVTLESTTTTVLTWVYAITMERSAYVMSFLIATLLSVAESGMLIHRVVALPPLLLLQLRVIHLHPQHVIRKPQLFHLLCILQYRLRGLLLFSQLFLGCRLSVTSQHLFLPTYRQ